MIQIFDMIGSVRNWIKSNITDPTTRLYSSTTLVAMGILSLGQLNVPATLSELQRTTGMSSMQIYRGTKTLTDFGLLQRNENGTWTWVVNVPNDIRNMHPASNNMDFDRLKALILESLNTIQSKTSNGRVSIEEVKDKVKQISPKPKEDTRSKTGPASVFGNMVLEGD